MRFNKNKNWGFLGLAFLALFTTQCGGSSDTIIDDDTVTSDTYDDDDSYDDGSGTGSGTGSGDSSLTISGTVTGLENTLRLTLNDNQETLNITEDGDFAFGTEFDFDAVYEVRVSRQSNDQTCELTNSSGNVNQSINITVTCDDKDWVNPDELSDFISPTTDDSEQEDVANQRHDLDIDELGNKVVTWIQSNGTTNKAFVAYYFEGEWELPSFDENMDPEGSAASASKVAGNDDGKFVVAFASDSKIYISEFDMENDSRFSHESTPLEADDQVNNTDSNASSPEVAVSENGDVMVVWTQSATEGTQEIFYTRYDHEDQTWMHLLDEDEDGYADGLSLDDGSLSVPDTDASSVKVEMDAQGNAVVAWLQEDANQNDQIFMSTYDAETDTWTTPTDLTDFLSISSTAVGSFEMAMNRNGDILIAWEQVDGNGDSQIYKAEFDSEAETWDSPAGLEDSISPNGTDATNPDVGIDQSGNMVIVWQQINDLFSSQIFMTEYRGSQWTHEYAQVDADYEFQLSHHISDDNDDFFNPATDPRVDMNSRQNAVITWIQTTENNTIQVFRDDYDSEDEEWYHENFLTADEIAADEFAVGKVGLNRFISVEDVDVEDSNVRFPEVAIGSYGDAQIIWTQQVTTVVEDAEDDEKVYHLFSSEFK